MALEEYRKKRDFDRTPEPAGEGPAGAAPRPGRVFVIQKHAASRLHYDFRLELDGVLLSWAVPKGPSLDPRDRHLAARVEDHPLDYGSFEGTIPKGEYGGGTVLLWDRGTWEPEGDPHEGLRKGDLKFVLHGEKLRGSWVLVRMKPRPGREAREEWLLIKHRDQEALEGGGSRILEERPESVASGRTLEEVTAAGDASVWHGDQPAGGQTDTRPGEDFSLDPSSLKGAEAVDDFPGFVRPELATLVEEAPSGDEWLHEIKFDGYRAIATIEKGSVRMFSRNDKDWTLPFRAIADELARLPVTSAVLDGEVVVRLPDGRTSFQELRDELGAAGRPAAAGDTGESAAADDTGKTITAGAGAGAGGGSGSAPGSRLAYYAFDLLHLDGYDLTHASLEDRKSLLRRLLARSGGDRILLSDHIPGEGGTVLDQACDLGLEGIVSKRAASPYRAGVRGREWVKTKCRNRQEFVIGGYTDPGGARTGFGALLLGVHTASGLRYVGKVGTGFDERSLDALAKRLTGMRIDDPPFTEDLQRAQKGSHWVRPELVAEVEFAEWTREGGIRHPSFKGLREDKPATEVVAEMTITHPDRVFWPRTGTTKKDLVDYYASVAERMLPYVIDRPVAMVRCPSGVEDDEGGSREQLGGKPGGGRSGKPAGCFFNKHPSEDFPGPVGRVMITESAGPAPYLTITGPGSLTAMAQMGVLEIHIWGSTWPDIERPDMIVIDLDPGPGVDWQALADGARLIRRLLHSLGLESFVKTTGGKGLHVVVPLTPNLGWKEISRFSRKIAERAVELAPDRFTSNMAKVKREGKIYVDYVRNNRGSTSIAPFSTRARERASVAVPLRWSELSGGIRPDTYTLESLASRLRRLRSDPWDGYFRAKDAQKLDADVMQSVGLE
jgi:bifunctional non-homologous end joining protein LigD